MNVSIFSDKEILSNGILLTNYFLKISFFTRILKNSEWNS